MKSFLGETLAGEPSTSFPGGFGRTVHFLHGRNVLWANRPLGELSLGRNVPWAKRPLANRPLGEPSLGRTVP